MSTLPGAGPAGQPFPDLAAVANVRHIPDESWVEPGHDSGPTLAQIRAAITETIASLADAIDDADAARRAVVAADTAPALRAKAVNGLARHLKDGRRLIAQIATLHEALDNHDRADVLARMGIAP